jgi:cyanophycinase-like exopeptidase
VLPSPGPNIRGIGVEQGVAVLLELDGKTTVVGKGSAYFIELQHLSGLVEKAKPLTFGDFGVQKVAPGHTFDLKAWTGDAIQYKLSVEGGSIRSTQAGGEVY